MSPAMLFVFIGDSRLTVPSFSSGTEALSSLPSETYPLVHLVNKHLITLYARDPGNAIKGKKKKREKDFLPSKASITEPKSGRGTLSFLVQWSSSPGICGDAPKKAAGVCGKLSRVSAPSCCTVPSPVT